MQLKSIKLVGFKSFVDPTTILVKGRMNGIVGPNGCGKSNIIDAVRWVIGERSAKQLRGQSMADVIFNGTTGRKPVGRASVELSFDNSDGAVVGEYANFSEIVVKREVFRDGQSDYSLNGTPCRRQDIVDIFYGTGLGSRSYAIIEQGMISRLIEAKPEDLRNHIEEAAGIAKYKQRRRDTENRIQHTKENLERLNDVREELEKQIRHLKRQATAAERYKELKEEERQVNAEIKALHWQVLRVELEKHQEKIQQRENEREKIQATFSGVETALEKTRLVQIAAVDQHNQAQKCFYSMGAEVARIEQRIKSTQEQFERWQTELTTTHERWQELSDSVLEYVDRMTELQSEIDQLKPQANSLSDAFRLAQEVLKRAENDMQAWTESWDQYQSRYAENSKLLEVSRTKLSHYRHQFEELSRRIARLKENRHAEQRDAVYADIAPLEVRCNTLKLDREALQTELDTLISSINDKKQKVDTLQHSIKTTQEIMQAKEARRISLKTLQEAVYQSDDAAVNRWLDEQGIKNYPRLGKDLRVTSGWEVAVETVLKGLFDAVCVDNLEKFIDDFKPVASGGLMLIENATQTIAHHSNLISLASQVSSEWPIAEWLGNVFIADTLEQAQRLRFQLHEHQSLITKEGVWLGKHWLRIAKAVNNDESILLREQELQRLEAEVLLFKNELYSFEAEKVCVQTDWKNKEERREQVYKQIQVIHSDITKAHSQLTEKQTRYDALMQQEYVLTQELNECVQRLESLQADIDEGQRLIVQHESVMRDVEVQRNTLLSEKMHYQLNLNEKRQQAQDAKQRADEYDIRLSSNENQLAVLQQTLGRDERQLEQLVERRDELNLNLEETTNPLVELREELQLQLNQQSDLERKLHQAADQLEQYNREITVHEASKAELHREIAEMQTILQQLQMDRQAVSVRQATISEQLAEAKLDLNVILTQLTEGAHLSEWEQKAHVLMDRITKLGPINLAAIEEHDQLSERKNYLDAQNADLVEALTVLEGAIHKIDKETRHQFKETFDKVNKSFQELFPKIFNGGQASLELDNEDFLSAGVIVRAQPPGKRNSTIHMLSGGEKALTAIAMVFGFFQLNPAPFCILDEVDAPLDDVNVGRYCRLIKEMSAKIQFIVISHNKVTIESADRLMGVTMQEPGVSRIVSVNMEEAVSLAEMA